MKIYKIELSEGETGFVIGAIIGTIFTLGFTIVGLSMAGLLK